VSAVVLMALALPLPPSGARWWQFGRRWTRLVPRGSRPEVAS
jgi:hypothetical protein